VGRLRLVVSGSPGSDVMVLKVELSDPNQDVLDRLAVSVRELTKLRAEVELVASGTLPNDGKLIDDIRRYE
jgi:phenylacetate-CoA ligase